MSPLIFGAARAVAGSVFKAFLALGAIALIGALVALIAHPNVARKSPPVKA